MKKCVAILILIGVFAYCLYAQPGPIQPVITNLTQFVNQTAWRVFYSDTDGDVMELALGANGTYLKSNGASSAPTWTAPAGAGDLLADGTVPMTANWDIGNFDITLKSLTGDGTVEGATITEGGVAVINATQGGVWTGVHDFGGADLEIPQASPAVPGVDGEIEYDFADGKLVIQHGSAHAELGASTDVAVAGLIRSWGGTIFNPDTINDVMTVKAINSIEFPHGVVITAIYLGVSEDSNYTLTVQNFDDFDTINAGNGTIDTIAYVADTTGEIIDTTPTFATIAAGQLIMISIPATDVDWIHFEIYYYEPAA